MNKLYPLGSYVFSMYDLLNSMIDSITFFEVGSVKGIFSCIQFIALTN